jgi:hypothetical protein
VSLCSRLSQLGPDTSTDAGPSQRAAPGAPHQQPSAELETDAMIISPDDKPSGRRRGGSRNAWMSAVIRLKHHLKHDDIDLVRCMVGLPGSGKSTWAAQHDEDGTLTFDATCVTTAHRATVVRAAHEAGIQVEAVVMSTSVRECHARQVQRPFERRVPHDVIDASDERMVLPDYDEGFARIVEVHS